LNNLTTENARLQGKPLLYLLPRSSHSAYPERVDVDTESLDEAQREQAVQSLLTSITRIRADRDGLRRDLQFAQAESKFTIQGLEKKVAHLSFELLSTSTNVDSVTAPDPPSLSPHPTITRLCRVSTASLVALAHFAFLRDEALRDLDEARVALESQEHEDEIGALELSLSEAQAELEVRTNDLAASTSQRAQLDAAIAQLKSQVNDLNDSNLHVRTESAHMQGAFEQNTAQLNELVRNLEAVEAERESLASQVLAVQKELEQAQAQVTESDARYVALQAKQLSSLPSDELMHNFRQQIKEYKDRVERRNEQIGKHQHDIKRLEVTQRLQEERLTELNNELDLALSEKETMIDDCAEAREARDTAVLRAEELEDELESLEATVQTLQLQHFSESSALVDVWASAVTKARNATGQFNIILRDTNSRHTEALRQLQDAEQQRSLTASVSDDRALQLAAAREEVELAHREARSAGLEIESVTADFKQATIALALSQSNLRRLEQLLTTERDERTVLEVQVRMVEEQLSIRLTEAGRLQSLLDGLRTETDLQRSVSQVEHNTRVQELEAEIQQLSQTISELSLNEAGVRDELVVSSQKLQDAVERQTAQAEAVRRLTEDMETMRLKHASELEPALARLETATRELEETRLVQATELAELQATIEELSASKASFEEHLQHTLAQLEDSGKAAEDLAALRAAHAAELDLLRAELAQVTKDLIEARAAHEDLSAARAQEIEELSAARSELEQIVADLETSVQTAEESLEQEHAAHAVELAAVTDKMAQREADVHALQEESKRVRAQHEEELQVSRESQERSARRFEQTQARLVELQDDLESTQVSLQEAETALQSAHEERTILEERTTSLEAEVQGLTSAMLAAERQLEDWCVTLPHLKIALLMYSQANAG
jgi:chromosome segregation ATPase